MSIVFSAIASHSPLLIPEIAKENASKCKQTINSYNKLSDSLVKSSPDTIIVFSPHGLVQPKSMSLNICSEFDGKFEEFGDFTNKFKIFGDIELAAKLKEALETKAQLQIISEPILDSGSAIPLFLLRQKLPKAKVVLIYHSQQDLQTHYDFGKLLKRELSLSAKKIAIIASADLSHGLSKQAPAEYSPEAKKFDKKVIKAIENNKVKDLIDLDPAIIKKVNETGIRTIVMLAGVLSEIEKTAKVLSYESPFGVGYLVVNYLF